MGRQSAELLEMLCSTMPSKWQYNSAISPKLAQERSYNGHDDYNGLIDYDTVEGEDALLPGRYVMQLNEQSREILRQLRSDDIQYNRCCVYQSDEQCKRLKWLAEWRDERLKFDKEVLGKVPEYRRLRAQREQQ